MERFAGARDHQRGHAGATTDVFGDRGGRDRVDGLPDRTGLDRGGRGGGGERLAGRRVRLLAACDGEPQTLALPAHELAHERNGDARRGLIVGSSLHSLSSERAEYLADELAASLAGTDAVIALHDALMARPAVWTAIRRVALSDDHAGASVIEQIRIAASPSDPAQRDDRRDRARGERQRLTSTHPPLASRITVPPQRPHRPLGSRSTSPRGSLSPTSCAPGWARTPTPSSTTISTGSPTAGERRSSVAHPGYRPVASATEFSRELRSDVPAADITLSIRLWTQPRVRTGGRYRVGPGEIQVGAVERIPVTAVTAADVRRAGEPDRETLRRRAAHAGPIDDDTPVYRIELHPVAPRS